MHFEEFDAFTSKLCRETARIIMRHFENPDLAVDSKSDNTPVTVADRESERVIRDAIATLYPEHGIMGEEFGRTDSSSAYEWVIDPIDGTKTFAAGTPLFGTMIALLREGEPLFGCINYPAVGRRISGDGQKAFVDGRPTRARSGRPLEEAIVLTTDVQSIAQLKPGSGFPRLLEQTRFCRTWGDCFGYYLVATGKADIMLDPILNPWDIMALVPVLRGAGACISDWRGAAAATGDSCIAANADLHETVVAILNT